MNAIHILLLLIEITIGLKRMNPNYQNFVNYLRENEIRFEDNEEAKLIRFGYNIDLGTIEIVVDFENDRRIGFFSFLNLSVTTDRKGKALDLVNDFNESLNYGSIIISQSNQLVYKIMYPTHEGEVKEDQWSEIIFRLWSISRDIFPLFGRLVFSKEEPQVLFEEFIHSKDKARNKEIPKQAGVTSVTTASASAPQQNSVEKGTGIWRDARDWYLQN